MSDAQDKQPTTILTLEQILAADDLEERTIFIAAWGGSVRIKALTRASIRRINQQATISPGVTDSAAVEKGLLCMGMLEPAVSPANYDKLDAKRAGAVDQIVAAIMDLSDIGTTALERARNSFDANPEQYFEFDLARELGMSVRRLRAEMPNAEVYEWVVYFEERAKQFAAERKKAEAAARSGRARRWE